MYSMLFALLVLVAIVQSVSGQVGGWFPADPDLTEAQTAATFAVNGKYGQSQGATFVITNVMKQVVAGLKLDITAEVTVNGACVVDHYQVWNRFGQLTAVVSETLTSATCAATATPELKTVAHNLRGN